LLSPLSPQNLLRKKKRKLMPSLLLQHQLLPQLRQQRLPKVSLLRKTHQKQTQKQTQKQPHQPLSNLNEGDDLIIDDEVTFGRNIRSRDFGKIVHENIELSDHVKFRLWLARQLAMKKYDEVWG
jgi:hypothetical protein